MPVKLNSAGGGSVTMDVGSTASNFTVNLPLANGDLVDTAATQTLTNKTLTSPTLTSPTIGGTPVMNASTITRGTAQTATGTVIAFTGIPSWVRQVTVMFDGVSFGGANDILVQLGDAGGIEATGYISYCAGFDSTGVLAVTTATNGIVVAVQTNDLTSGTLTFVNQSGNLWLVSGNLVNQFPELRIVSGTKTLSDVLTQIRVTRTGGDVFDAGTINIMYE
jgi:hypothetical protein